MDLQHWLGRAVEANREWSEGFGPFPAHPSLDIDDTRFAEAFREFTERLKDNYPFFSPPLRRADAQAPASRRHRRLSGARILRSVLMKPESEHHVTGLHTRVEELARRS